MSQNVHFDIYSYIAKKTDMVRHDVKTRLFCIMYTGGVSDPASTSNEDMVNWCEYIIDTYFTNKKPH